MNQPRPNDFQFHSTLIITYNAEIKFGQGDGYDFLSTEFHSNKTHTD